MATGRRLQPPSRPRTARAHRSPIDRCNLRTITARPRPSSPARVARQPPLGALPLARGEPGSRAARGQLVSAAAAWPGAWLRARVDATSHLTFPGAGRELGAGRRPGRVKQLSWSWRKFIDPFLISGSQGFLRWGPPNGGVGGGGEDPCPAPPGPRHAGAASVSSAWPLPGLIQPQN